MKITTCISAGVFIFFSAWVMKKKEMHEQTSSLYNTKWNLKRIHTDSTIDELTGKAFIRFDNEKKSAGGNGGCNAFGGTLAVSGNTFQLTNIFSTKMYCEGIQPVEDVYLKYLSVSNRFVISGKFLSLYKNKELLLEFMTE